MDRRWAVPAWLEQSGRWSWNIIAVGIVLFGTMRLLTAIRFVMIPVLIAALGAALLAPVKERLARLLSNTIATSVVLIAATATVFGVLGVTSALVGNELAAEAQWIETREQTREWLMEEPLELSEAEVDRLWDRAEGWFTNGVGQVNADRALFVGQLMGGGVLALILMFLFLRDGAELWGWVTRRIRPGRRGIVHDAGLAAFQSLGGYVRGVSFAGLVDGVLIGGALALLGVPLAVPVGVLTFFAAYFPILGATVVGGLAMLIAFVSNGVEVALLVALAAFVVQQIEGNILLPMIMKRTVSLHPAVVLTALALGGGLGGIAGAFVAVPVAAMVVAAAGSARTSLSHVGISSSMDEG